MKNLVIDFGGTRIKFGVTHNGNLLCSDQVDPEEDKGFIKSLAALENQLKNLLERHNIRHENLSGIGFSFPGIIDSHNMKLLSVNDKYNDAMGFDYIGWAHEKWGLPIYLENDSRAAVVGEWQYGAGQGYNDMAMITLGTGVGGSVIIRGKILRGMHFQAGCLPGHFTVNFTGMRCNCGNIGCVESEASTWRLPELVKKHSLFNTSKLKNSLIIDYREIFQLASEKDELSVEIMNVSLEAWSACVVNMIHAYDPEIVVIGGGIMASGDIILPYIRNKVAQHAWVPWGNVQILPAMYKEEAALLGLDFIVRKTIEKVDIYL